MRYFTFLTATLPFFPLSYAVPPKPKPKPGPPTPVINTTVLSSPPLSVNQVIPSQSENSFFGNDLAANEFLTAISGDSFFSIYSTSKSHKWNSPIETVEYSARETITSLTVCGNVVAVAMTENLCDDNFLNCQIVNPQLSFFRIRNGKISSIKSYGGSYLHDSLYPTASGAVVENQTDSAAAPEASYLMNSLNVVCSNDAVIVTSSWKDINATSPHQTSYGAILGTELSTAFTSPISQQYQFDRLDFDGIVASESIVSVAMSDKTVMVASLSTSSIASPVTHFFSFDFPATAPYNLTDSSSSALFHICSLASNPDPLLNLNSPATALSTAIHLNTAVLGLSQLSEVYVYTVSDQSSDSASASSPSLWLSVGILKASDSFLGDLFGYSVFVSSETVVVGAPQALSANTTRVDRTGAVYVYRRNASSQQWFEEKIVKAATTEDSFSSSIHSAFGSRVSGTSSALFLSDVPMAVRAALGVEVSNSSEKRSGQVFILWTDSSSNNGSDSEGSGHSSQWKSTVMWALVLISIPVAVAFALVGFRSRSSLCTEHQGALLVPDTPGASSSSAPSPFLLTSCVESSSENGPTPASIIRLSPLFPHVLRSSALPQSAKTSQPAHDVESNCSTSPGNRGARAASKWRLGGPSNDYRHLSVPDSPSCRSEVSTVSLESGSAGATEGGDQSTWLSRLTNAFKFNSASSSQAIDAPLPPLILPGLAAETSVTLQRSTLQSPHPQQQQQTPATSNPMISPAVVSE